MLSDDPAHLPATEQDLAAILRWYVEMGVDTAVSDAPRDHFAESAAQAGQKAKSPPEAPVFDEPPVQEAPAPMSQEVTVRAPRRTAPIGRAIQAQEPLPVRTAAGGQSVSPEQAQAAAREIAAAAPDLAALQLALDGFDGCALKRTASRLVFADGNPAARIMLVGDAPGAEEDRQGLPFVGSEGLLLDRMLAAIGLDRTKIYIANVVPWRPPGNRPPTPAEVGVCLPFCERHIELVGPDLLILFGNIPTQALLGRREPITQTRGKVFDYAPSGASRIVKAMPMFHPSFLRSTPTSKKLAWQDLRTAKKTIESGSLV